MTIHAYVDHSIIAVIFNNRTSLTVSVKPSAEDSTGMRCLSLSLAVFPTCLASFLACVSRFTLRCATGVATVGAGVTATVHKLNAANQNAGAIANPEFLNANYNASDPSTHMLGGSPPEKWLLPQIHNSPACLSGRKPSFPLSN